MSIKDVVNAALVGYIQRTEDSDASEVLKVFEEVEHALLSERYDYGTEDKFTVKIIYRCEAGEVCTFYYHGTFGEMIREIVDYEERQEE